MFGYQKVSFHFLLVKKSPFLFVISLQEPSPAVHAPLGQLDVQAVEDFERTAGAVRGLFLKIQTSPKGPDQSKPQKDRKVGYLEIANIIYLTPSKHTCLSFFLGFYTFFHGLVTNIQPLRLVSLMAPRCTPQPWDA
jgi:hypothetical protein